VDHLPVGQQEDAAGSLLAKAVGGSLVATKAIEGI